MRTIDEVLGDVLQREGWPRVTNHSADLGGLTKGGVTMRAYNAFREKYGMPALTREQFVNDLTELDARAFFLSEYFRPFGFIKDDGIYAFVGDWAVHAGVDDPAKALQRELAARGLYTGAVDGDPGPKTRAAWSSLADDPVACREIRAALIRARVEFHIDRALDREVLDFIRTHPRSQLVFLRGWVRRACAFVD